MRILTFDIEDWFHLLDHSETESIDSWDGFESRITANVEYILEQLFIRGQKATFFILGWVAEKYPPLVRLISEQGHQIGTHSYAHSLVYKQDPYQFQQDITRSLSVIEDCIGIKVDSYRAPGFSITETETWALDILAQNGIIYDSSIFPAPRSHGGFSSFEFSQPVKISTSHNEIKEFPLNYQTFLGKRFVFSGGGYFRITPTLVLEYLFRRNEYLMTYFHPRDFDSNQPIVPNLNLTRKFKSYVGLSGAKSKFERILDCTEFESLVSFDSKFDWDKAPIVYL